MGVSVRIKKLRKKVRGSQKSEEEGGWSHFAFFYRSTLTHLTKMLILSEHYSPSKAMCEVKLFMHLHKKHLFDRN